MHPGRPLHVIEDPPEGEVSGPDVEALLLEDGPTGAEQ